MTFEQSPPTVDPPHISDKIVDEVLHIDMATANDSQQFSILRANQQAPAYNPILRHGPFFGGADSAEQKFITALYAVRYPNRQILYIDTASHGCSDNMSKAQYKEVSRGSIEGLTQAQAQAIRNKLPNAETPSSVAESYGALALMSMAYYFRQMDMAPDKNVSFDMIGLEDRLTLGVSKAFFIDEVRNTNKLYREGEHNAHLEAQFQAFVRRLEERGFDKNAFNMADIYKRDPRLAKFIVMQSPMARSIGVGLTERALDANKDLEIVNISGSKSAILRYRKVRSVLEMLQQKYPGRYDWRVWLGESHGMALATQQPKLVEATQSIL